MKAAVLYEANTPLQVVDLEQQGPLPMVLGHEAAGIVEEVGSIEKMNEGFTAMRTGQVARGVVVFN